MAISAPVEAKDELVETGLKALGVQPVADAPSPALEVAERGVDPGENFTGGPVAADMGLVTLPRRLALQDGILASRRRPGALPSPSSTAPATGILPSGVALRQAGLVNLDQTGQRAVLGVDHGAAKLGGEHPGAAAGPDPEPLLQRQGGDVVGMSGHQIGGPEPNRERQLGSVRECAGGDRGLTMATGALEAVRPGLQLPPAIVAAGGTLEAVRPSDGDEPPGAGVVVGEPALEGDGVDFAQDS